MSGVDLTMLVMDPVYLDAHATTPLDPRVRDRLNPWLSGESFGNAGSPHAWGQHANEATELARRQVASLLDASPGEVIFTSGATESNNLALSARPTDGRRHIISCVTEHPSVREPLAALEAEAGIDVSWVGVDACGRLDLEAVSSAIGPETLMISAMAANNETGTLHALSDLGELAATRGLLFHCDGAQAAGRIPLTLRGARIDLFSLSAHKMYGPMGVGALYISCRAQPLMRPQIMGGGQQQGLRSGTVNVPGAVGLGAACEIAEQELLDDAARLEPLRDGLEQGLLDLGDVRVNGEPDHRLPATSNVMIEGVPAEALIAGCPEVAFSAGSACSTGSPAPSHVLAAMGLSAEAAECSVRFGLTRFTTEQDIDHALDRLSASVRRVRALVHA